MSSFTSATARSAATGSATRSPAVVRRTSINALAQHATAAEVRLGVDDGFGEVLAVERTNAANAARLRPVRRCSGDQLAGRHGV